jgi:hypothetical protein
MFNADVRTGDAPHRENLRGDGGRYATTPKGPRALSSFRLRYAGTRREAPKVLRSTRSPRAILSRPSLGSCRAIVIPTGIVLRLAPKWG